MVIKHLENVEIEETWYLFVVNVANKSGFMQNRINNSARKTNLHGSVLGLRPQMVSRRKFH